MEDINEDINRQQNLSYLFHCIDGASISMVIHRITNQPHILIPSLNISFSREVMNEIPFRFREFMDSVFLRVAEERSSNIPKIVKTVSKDHGRQYFITSKILKGKKCENNCSICLEKLLPDDKKRKKIWELECGCKYCVACVRKWFRQDSRCPNCRNECSVE